MELFDDDPLCLLSLVNSSVREGGGGGGRFLVSRLAEMKKDGAAFFRWVHPSLYEGVSVRPIGQGPIAQGPIVQGSIAQRPIA